MQTNRVLAAALFAVVSGTLCAVAIKTMRRNSAIPSAEPADFAASKASGRSAMIPEESSESTTRTAAVDVAHRGMEQAAVHGRIEMQASDGSAIQGTISLAIASQGIVGANQSAPIVASCWQVAASPGDRILIRDMTIDGKRAYPEYIDYAAPSAGELVVSASFQNEYSIRVVDMQTGEAIPEVDVMRNAWHVVPPGFSPGGSSTVSVPFPGSDLPTRRLKTPLRVSNVPLQKIDPGDLGVGSFLVSAPKYAWKRVDISQVGHSCPTLKLTRGNDVVIRIMDPAGALARRQCALEFYRIGAAPGTARPDYLLFPVASSEFCVTRVACGAYELRMSYMAGGKRIPLGTAMCTVSDEEIATAQIEISDLAPDTNRTETFGVLYCSQASTVPDRVVIRSLVGTGDERRERTFQNADGTLRRNGAEYSWGGVMLTPGDYALEVLPQGYVQLMTVPSAPQWLCISTLNAPLALAVNVVDSRSKQPVAITSYFFKSGNSQQDLGPIIPSGYAQSTPANPLQLEIWGPVVRLDVSSKEHGVQGFLLDVAGVNAATVELHPPCTLLVEAMAFGVPLALEPGWWQQLSVQAKLPASGRCVSMKFGGAMLGGYTRSLITISEPGEYRVVAPLLSGRAAIPDSAQVLVGVPGIGLEPPRVSLDLTPAVYQ